jgi:dUTP pyrophosphatase
MIDLHVKLLNTYAGPEAPLTPAHDTDAGADLYATEEVHLLPGSQALVSTGISVAVPPGYEMQIRPKSGRSTKEGLTVLNTPGTVDPDYRGEVKVVLFNSRPVLSAALIMKMLRVDELLFKDLGKDLTNNTRWAVEAEIIANTIRIKRGEKIAQAVFAKFERPTIRVVDQLPTTERGAGGFGSTGLAQVPGPRRRCLEL